MSADDGMMRLAVRVRPPQPREALERPSSGACVQALPGGAVRAPKTQFTFDAAYGPTATQREVYEGMAEHLVGKCIEGYNAACVVYGQTGAGKTHTIGTEAAAGGEGGIIQFALRDVFTAVAARPDYRFEVSVSFTELYMEEMRDLLAPPGRLGPGASAAAPLAIREDESGDTVVLGAEVRIIGSVEEGMSCLREGAATRRVASTASNARSSRSHAIFTVTVSKTRVAADAEGPAFTRARLHLVDLAGSERAKRTGNRGLRLKESSHINSGLLALSNVVSALGDRKRRAKHVPYRDSKLTRLLKDALGGNSVTSMLVCVSPAEASLAETLCSLKYAARAKNIRNTPRVNVEPEHVEVERMKRELTYLRQQLDDRQPAVADGDAVRELQRQLTNVSAEVEGAMPELTAVLQPAAVARLVALLERSRELGADAPSPCPSWAATTPFSMPAPAAADAELLEAREALAADEAVFAQQRATIERLERENAELRTTLAARGADEAGRAKTAGAVPEAGWIPGFTLGRRPTTAQERQTAAERSRAASDEHEDVVCYEESGSEGSDTEEGELQTWLEAGLEAARSGVEQGRAAEVAQRSMEALAEDRRELSEVRDSLQLKKLRRSQALGSGILRIASSIRSLDEQMAGATNAARELDELTAQRDVLVQRKAAAEAMVADGDVLEPAEELELAAHEEELAVIETAMEYHSAQLGMVRDGAPSARVPSAAEVEAAARRAPRAAGAAALAHCFGQLVAANTALAAAETRVRGATAERDELERALTLAEGALGELNDASADRISALERHGRKLAAEAKKRRDEAAEASKALYYYKYAPPPPSGGGGLWLTPGRQDAMP